ncbi:hypothetical protein V6Z92_002108 [Aspergillus fumigatus]
MAALPSQSQGFPPRRAGRARQSIGRLRWFNRPSPCEFLIPLTRSKLLGRFLLLDQNDLTNGVTMDVIAITLYNWVLRKTVNSLENSVLSPSFRRPPSGLTQGLAVFRPQVA